MNSSKSRKARLKNTVSIQLQKQYMFIAADGWINMQKRIAEEWKQMTED